MITDGISTPTVGETANQKISRLLGGVVAGYPDKWRDLPAVTSSRSATAESLIRGEGELVLQLHHRGVGHHHGRVGDPDAPVGNGVLVWFGEVSDFDAVLARAAELEAPVVRAPHRNPPPGDGNGPGHRELWISDPDGYTVVIASPDGEAWQPRLLERRQDVDQTS